MRNRIEVGQRYLCIDNTYTVYDATVMITRIAEGGIRAHFSVVEESDHSIKKGRRNGYIGDIPIAYFQNTAEFILIEDLEEPDLIPLPDTLPVFEDLFT